MLEFMNQAGIFGTRAPLFMDIVSLIVLFLPFLMLGIISLARIEKYKLHAMLQTILFFVSVTVLVFFEIGVRFVGGYNAFIEGSSAEHNYALGVLIFHIAISVITLVIWITTLFKAKAHLENGKHKLFGWMTFTGVVLTVLTGGWVYYLLFVY